MVEVGNCCVNKFLGLKEANRIFESVSRIRKDINRNMNKEALQYLLDKKLIRKHEFDFYDQTFRKRNLSKR